MMNPPRPRITDKTFSNRRGHGNQLSISDPSHHVTEAIGTLYGDSDDDSSHEHRFDSRPLSFMASPSGGEQIPKLHLLQLQSSEQKNLDARKGPISDDTNMVKSQAVANGNGETRSRHPSQQSHAFSTQPVSPLSPTLSLRDGPTDSPNPSRFPLTNIDNPNDIAQELSNLQALRRMSMDVGNTADPDLVPFQGLSLMTMPSIAPTGEDDEGDISRLLWVPAEVHPELAPDQFRNFLEKRVQSINRRSGESQLAADGQSQLSSVGGLERKRSMLSRQIDDRSSGNSFKKSDSMSEGRQLQPSVIDSTGELNLSDLVKDPSRAVQKLTLESQLDSGTEKCGLDDDKPILPVATMGLRRSTRTTYRKGGSLRSGDRLPFSKRAAAARQAQRDGSQEMDESDHLSPSEFDVPTGHRLQRVQSEPITAENFSRPTRPATRKQPSTQSGTPAGTPKQDVDKPEDSIPTPSIVAPSADSGSAPQEPVTIDFDSDTAQQPDPFPQRSSSQHVPYAGPTQTSFSQENEPLDAQTGLEELQRHRQFQQTTQPPQQPPPRSSKRPLTGRPALEASSPTVHSTDNSTTVSHSANRIPAEATHMSVRSGTPANADSSASLSSQSIDERKSEKKFKDKEDTEGSKSMSWKWFKSDDRDKKKREKDEQTKQLRTRGAGDRLHPEKGHDATRLDLLQNSIDNASPKGREGIILARESVDGKLYDEKKKEGNRKVSDARKEKDGFFGSIFGGSRRKESKDAASTKSKQRTVSPDPPILPLPRPDIDYPYTRFPIVEERAIYRMAHIKLANPRRDLRSQVLLSNFMYSYLAKVQAMHPQLNVPTSPHQKRQEEERRRQEQEQQQHQFLQQQQLAQQEQDEQQKQEHNQGSIEQYNFEYHRETTQYGDTRHQSDNGGVDYVDDAQIFDYDHSDQGGNATIHQHRQLHQDNADDRSTRGYYDYPHSEDKQHDNGVW